MKNNFVWLLLLGLGCLLNNTPARANQVKNPGFDSSGTAPTSWTIGGSIPSMQPLITIDSQMKLSGAYSLKMSGNNNPNCNGKVTQMVGVTGGETYLFSATFKPVNVYSVNKSVFIKIIWYNGNSNIGTHFMDGITAEANGWITISRKVRALTGATNAQITLEFRWSTGTVWWDDIALDPTTAVPARNIKVGTVYCRPPGPTAAANISAIGALIDQAGAADCDILCLGEGWTTYNTGIGMGQNEVNTLTGSAAVMLAQKALQYNMYIVSGLYIWTGDTLNNVAVLFDRQGQQQGVYKKVHLPNSEVEEGAVPGDSFPVFTTDFGTIGIQICWDVEFPEVSRILALKGAEILFCPNWGNINGDMYKLVARARAADNGVFFVYSIYDGHSLIVNPAGDILQESGTTTQLLTATIDLNYSPAWDWLGSPGRCEWKSVWQKDRRSDVFQELSAFRSAPPGPVFMQGAPKTAASEPLLWYTNPVTAQTVISYLVQAPGNKGTQKVSLVISDLAGKPVRDLVRDQAAPGRYEIVWDTKDNNGKTVCDGVYLCTLQSGGKEYVQRITVIK
jgi:predicted amidohydrolase